MVGPPSPTRVSAIVGPSITDPRASRPIPTGDRQDLEERPDPGDRLPRRRPPVVRLEASLVLVRSISYLDAGDQMAIDWYRPDGSLAVSNPYTVSSFVDHGGYDFDLTLPPSVWAADPGTWQVAAVVDGTQLGRTSFVVTSGSGDPTIKVEQGSTYILDDRTTPIDFGTVPQSWTGPELTFTVENIGSNTLTTGGLSLPRGFTPVGSFPATIPAGASGTFTVQLSSASVGSQFGQITFQTNDPSAPTFGFNVSGVITGTPPAGAPAIQLSGAAAATGLGSGPLVLGPGGDPERRASPQGFDGGSLTISMASGGTRPGDDRLSILNQGSAPGQVGFNGSGVYYGSTQIGTASITAGPATLSVALNANAILAAVQALLDDITYQNVAKTPTTAPRYVRFSVVDGAGLASNLAIETVVNSGVAIVSPPKSPPPILSPPPTPSPAGPPPLGPRPLRGPPVLAGWPGRIAPRAPGSFARRHGPTKKNARGGTHQAHVTAQAFRAAPAKRAPFQAGRAHDRVSTKKLKDRPASAMQGRGRSDGGSEQ